MSNPASEPFIAIACGGTGGHLFPGIAVAGVLRDKGCQVMLLVSEKSVDQQSLKAADGLEVTTLSAVALQEGQARNAISASWDSFRMLSRMFRKRKPNAVLAMGGFTSAAPILAGKLAGATTFLHEANSIPGRANRWLSPFVDQVFISFSMAALRLRNRSVMLTGMPVRPQFPETEPGAACRIALSLRPDDPVLLITGGSQGATSVNSLVCEALPLFKEAMPSLQFIHLTGTEDVEKVRRAYKSNDLRAAVFPFLTEMELALGAATVAVTRAGASSLAEMAAMHLPAILIPYPWAADDHQYFNARSFADSGAARLMPQRNLTAKALAVAVLELIHNADAREAARRALDKWFFPNAATDIANKIFRSIDRNSGIVDEQSKLSLNPR
ncbi:MAG: UDP-N-acetylglucosamine--N-acetylmuramyl-(pentapeptide) pyrophosphoryl-undecaprenol [Verrucomicrobiales bacterium]|nr:UDP-N-acetylglucosamine--N-acetylmuramyl-(pentapeptide) pyrophosphoryl-undecaprenol [Verrucomicrobiales bacterium]